MTAQLEVLLVPPAGHWPDADAYAVVDALRATTMVATLLHHGATAVIAAEAESVARALARERGALLAGEVGGVPPAGFDLGNSPASVQTAAVAGREVVLFTTNGTLALCAAARRGRTIAAAALNADAAARWLAESHRVAIVCAGEARGTIFALEDLAAAAFIVRALVAARLGLELGDGARLALMLPDPVTAIGASAHADDLRSLGLENDIAVAQAVDAVRVVPVVTALGNGWARIEPARA
jgi:2-phosphosulfolactate phosphatase